MKLQRILYWISTVLLTVLMGFSASMYFINYEAITEAFIKMGYPTYIIYPLAIAKILGLAVLWINKWKALKEWAYAGFFFDFVLAYFAHEMVGESGVTALVATIILLTSYFFGKKVRP
ncbi:DoxX family protein [Ascidiimonas sp. W6]|uniref:DoxX family protein n=1 Tax=Ascidiimonas meishanensis TaxID=3128903 RepID=UPI0030EC76BC